MRQQYKYTDNTNHLVGVDIERGVPSRYNNHRGGATTGRNWVTKDPHFPDMAYGGNRISDSNYVIAGSNSSDHVIAGGSRIQRRDRPVDYIEPLHYNSAQRDAELVHISDDVHGGFVDDALDFGKDVFKGFLGMGIYEEPEPEDDDDVSAGSFGNFIGSTIRSMLGGSTANTKQEKENKMLLQHIVTLMGRVTKIEEELRMPYTKEDNEDFLNYQLKLHNKLQKNNNTKGGEIAPKSLLGSDPVSLPPSSVRLSSDDF